MYSIPTSLRSRLTIPSVILYRKSASSSTLSTFSRVFRIDFWMAPSTDRFCDAAAGNPSASI